MKRLAGCLLALLIIVPPAVPSAQAGEWRFGGGLAPYTGMHPHPMVDWGTGWIFSANAEFVWTRHFRQYGHLTYGFKGSGDTADKNFPIETFSTGPELFFRPFYIGVGLGSVWAPWVNFRQSDETKPTGEVGTLTSERFLEFPIGLEFRVAKDYYIHVDLTREIWTFSEGWNYFGEARTMHLDVKF